MISLGEEMACSVIDEYLKLVGARAAAKARFGLPLVFAVLFETHRPPGNSIPIENLIPQPPPPNDNCLFPLHPICIQENLPFNTTMSYLANTVAGQFTTSIRDYRSKGQFCQEPIKPTLEPQQYIADVIPNIVETEGWIDNQAAKANLQSMLNAQARRLENVQLIEYSS